MSGMDRNPAMRRAAKKATQSKGYWQSNKKEKRLAKTVGGRTTLASGAKREKGDVRKVGVARIEHKITQRKSFSVTRDMVTKIVNSAVGCEEIPSIVIEFINPETGKSEGEIACIPMQNLVELLQDE